MRLILLALTLVSCVSDDDTGPVEADTDTDTDTDTDSDTDSDSIDLPCEGVEAILDFPGSYSGVLDRDDPERWTGVGDLPTELLAVELADTSTFRLTVTYPTPNLGTSTRYYMRANFVGDDCAIRVANSSVGGDGDNDTVTWLFTPEKAGWWFPMLYFPEAMVQPGSISYTAEIGPE